MSSPVFPGVSAASYKELLGLENRQVIINYLTELKTINPSADNNWKFTDNIANLDLRFLSAASAKDLIANLQDIKFLQDAENGFGEYKLLNIVSKVPNTFPTVEPKENAEVPAITINDKETTLEAAILFEESVTSKEVAENNDTNKEVSEKVTTEVTTSETKDKAKVLPKTGVVVNSTVVIGLVLLSLIYVLNRRKENN